MSAPFAASEEQEALRTAVRRYLENEYRAPGSRQSAPGGACASEHWQAFARQGWLGVLVPDELGGVGGSAGELIAICEGLGRSLVVEPFVPSAVLATSVIVAAAGSQAHARGLLTPMIAGERIVAVAYSEADSDGGAEHASTLARKTADAYVLNGAKTLVLGGPFADSFIVSARLPAGAGGNTGISLFIVPRSASGCRVRSFSLVNGQGASELELKDVSVGHQALLGSEGGGLRALEWGLSLAILACCAELVGGMDRALALTAEHLKGRKQFGVPLGSFQALQHRMADHAVARALCVASLGRGQRALQADSQRGRRDISAMKVKVCGEARTVLADVIQMHGGIGMAEEHIAGHFYRNALVKARLFGDQDYHARQVASGGTPHEDDRGSDSLDLWLGPKERRFREHVRTFLRANLAPEITTQGVIPFLSPREHCVRWQAILHREGWGAPNWRSQHGGPDWSPLQRLVFAVEACSAGAPTPDICAQQMIGPVLNEFGSSAQLAEHIPHILAGTRIWTQGFSEPESGSDLASVKTHMVRQGNEYVIRGQKIWTSNAHVADWIFLLVRTDTSVKKQAGLSFVLADLATPGFTVRPIWTIDGSQHVNEVFIDDVRVPIGNLIGEEGQGWAIAKFLLTNERTTAADLPGLLRYVSLLGEMGRRERRAGRPLAEDAAFAARLTGLEIEVRALEALVVHVATAQVSGEQAAELGAILKLEGARLQQKASEMAMAALGDFGLTFVPAHPSGDCRAAEGREYAAGIASDTLFRRAVSIAGGTNEVQRAILARTVFGL